ncbi:HemK2/MTQ2 family protein methyltransferase [Streptomyces sp. YIM 130001]|uniref:HemK2/MTQ2 family protein methyltransferase n=1 Tax=Streptomyces sp. YIM 130001 TaxID=2259644 RepID=UPI000E658B37|nr:HemK2/MTQ2 family protein methyltransferase [Streptomyces sp. YIM 130001]
MTTTTPTSSRYTRPLRLLRPPGVYAPQHDTRLLLNALHHENIGRGAELLDVGTGTGALALHAARLGARVTAVDVSWRAVLTARLNARLSGHQVRVRRGTIASFPGHGWDIVISNPPYVPSPDASLPTRGAARSWDAGHDGRAVLDSVCDGAAASLRPGGVLLLVHSGLCGTGATLRRLRRAGMRAEVSERTFVPYGPVLQSRAGWLRETRLVTGTQQREELVVIRAERA